jgi:hypothetical protein
MRGERDSITLIVEALGPKAPKANRTLKDPASALAIELYAALGAMGRGELYKLVRELTGAAYVDGSHRAMLKRAKEIVNEILDIDVEGVDADDPMAAWKMWPFIITKKEKGMATNKQATKRKTSSKRVSKKTSSKKVAKKKVTKKRTGNKGKPAGTKLKTPVKKDGKRGKVLAKFMGKSGKTPDQAAKELKTNRSNVLSHLHDLNRYHGIGYVLSNGEPVKILKPKGCKNVWA